MTETVLICILSSAAAAAVVQSVKELILWTLNRKAKIQDANKEEEKECLDKELADIKQDIKDISTKLGVLTQKIDSTVQHDKIILHDKIKYLISKYVEYGEISMSERQAIHHMWSIYHFDLGGNGDLDDWMSILDELPIREERVHI